MRKGHASQFRWYRLECMPVRSPEKAHNLREVGGGTATMKSELERIGYLGSIDPMLTAAKLIPHSHNVATELGCLASTGILALKLGSTNTVPGFVQFSLDIRSR